MPCSKISSDCFRRRWCVPSHPAICVRRLFDGRHYRNTEHRFYHSGSTVRTKSKLPGQGSAERGRIFGNCAELTFLGIFVGHLGAPTGSAAFFVVGRCVVYNFQLFNVGMDAYCDQIFGGRVVSLIKSLNTLRLYFHVGLSVFPAMRPLPTPISANSIRTKHVPKRYRLPLCLWPLEWSTCQHWPGW